MNRKILAFGASSSKNSINKKFANYAASLVSSAEVTLLDLNDYEMPIYSIDKEKEMGIPQLAHDFKNQLTSADGIVISFAEHNGSYSAAFKNIFDWISRIESDVWNNKPMFLLATSPGGRGGRTVLDIAVAKFSRMTEGGVFSFSLPSFGQNFDEGIQDETLDGLFKKELEGFVNSL